MPLPLDLNRFEGQICGLRSHKRTLVERLAETRFRVLDGSNIEINFSDYILDLQ